MNSPPVDIDHVVSQRPARNEFVLLAACRVLRDDRQLRVCCRCQECGRCLRDIDGPESLDVADDTLLVGSVLALWILIRLAVQHRSGQRYDQVASVAASPKNTSAEPEECGQDSTPEHRLTWAAHTAMPTLNTSPPVAQIRGTIRRQRCAEHLPQKSEPTPSRWRD